MVLTMGGAWFSDAGNSFAAGKITTKKYAASTANGTQEASEKNGETDADRNSDKNENTDADRNSDKNENTDADVNNDKNAQAEDVSVDKAEDKKDSSEPADSKTKEKDTDTKAKLTQREIKAKVEEAVLYENNAGKKTAEALSRVNAFIKALTGEKPEIDESSKAPADDRGRRC